MKLVVGNLKMNLLTKVERDNYFKGIENSLMGRNFKEVNFVFCPPFVHLEAFIRKFEKRENVFLGVQNIHEEEKGRFTGEISAPMIKNLGGKYVIVGHSDRRRIFNESDELVNKKIKVVLDNDMIPIMCIGETQEERDDQEIKKVILHQLSEGLRDITKAKISKIVIAYEPVWAIGSGLTPTGDEIMEVRILIQKTLINMGLKLEELPIIIYGGSVNLRNIRENCSESGMQGVLVGGESLHPMDFIKIGEILEK